MFAVLHIADFSLQAVLRTEREATMRPAALFTEGAKKSLVIATNAAARASNVECGMTAPHAVARCPTLLIRTPNPAAEADARAALLAVGFTISPTIEDTGPGVCTIDLKGTSPAQNERAAAAAINELASLGLNATAGIATTPLLALYAARAAARCRAGSLTPPLEASCEKASERPLPVGDRKRDGGVGPFDPIRQAQGRQLRPGSINHTPELPLLGEAAAAYSAIRNPQSEILRTRPHAGSLRPDTPQSEIRNPQSESPPLAGARSHADRHSAVRNPQSAIPPLAGARSHPIENPESKIENPSPVFLVTEPASFLAPLPISAADPSPEMAEILASWGLRTLGQLTALSRDDIGRRLGSDGTSLWDRASGGAPRPLNPVLQAQTFSAAMEFEQEVETLEPLLFILRRFIDRLSLELRAACFVAAELHLTLTLANQTQHERSFRLPEPTADPGILFRAVHTHLESLHTTESIIAVGLRATPARPLVRQHGLFDTGLRDPHGFSETLARIAAIVGPDRVGTPVLQDTHRPDAVKLVPPPAVIPPPSPAPIHAALGLPLRRFRPWLRAQLELTEGRPTYLWTERFNGPIAEVHGPWLSSGDWWQPDLSWRRTEYDIALTDGGLYRLVFADRSWFVEGEYD